jgi:hypothetical protein
MEKPTLEVRQSKDTGYLVIVTWPKGLEQEVAGFATEAEARAWINDEAPDWIARNHHSRLLHSN